MVDEDKRFIEESFPVKEVGIEAACEKNIRHGHISTLHIWWARRPLASSRATNYAALVPAPKNIDEWNRRRDFIIEFSKWENSLNGAMIKQAREDILNANGSKPPRVLDPFGGGGSIPLEALRLGCEVYSGDYNPVAVLIQKCTLEYPLKYSKPAVKKHDAKPSSELFEDESKINPLLEDVKRWGDFVLKEAKKELGRFYTEEEDGSIPVGYIWARTIPCQNPSCETEIPLMRQYWLARKNNKNVLLYPYVKDNKVAFRIVGDGYGDMPQGFDPSNGSVSRAVATCPVCGSVVDANTTRRLFQEGKSDQRMVAVVLHKPGVTGKHYRTAEERDVKVYKEAEVYLEEKRKKLMEEWGMDPVPDEHLPPAGTLGFRIQRYNMNTWGDLFNARQKLALITFVEKVRQAYQKMMDEGYDEEYARAVVSYLSLMLGKLEDWNSLLSIWRPDQERNEHVFNRQALPMVWDYGERNPLEGMLMSPRGIDKIIEHCSFITNTNSLVTQCSATNLPYQDNFFDTVFTDPPYYDNVPYSYLSDFFYVWLKRTLGDLYPDLFSTPLTPKKNEIVAYSKMEGGFEEGKRFFEDMLKKSFQEIHRVLKPNGIAVIVYAHKSTAGWETLINSLLDSGLVVTGAWPINTEMKARLRANESAVLASSIYIVSRNIEKKQTGFYNEIKSQMYEHLNKKLERLWAEGIGGADFFISAIGSAVEVFGSYEQVMDYEGNIIRAERLLDDVRKIATDYAVNKILHNGFSEEISGLTRFYVLWRWEYGEARVMFDEARLLASSCGIDISNEWNRLGFVKKEKEFIRVIGPHERKIEEIDTRRSKELIDILHKALLLWEKSKKDALMKLLTETGFGQKDHFYRVGQAISETLTNESREKKLLDGFLSGRERLKKDVRGGRAQQYLFDG